MDIYGRNEVDFYALPTTFSKESATMNLNFRVVAIFPIVTHLKKSSISRCILHSKISTMEP